MKLRVVGWAVVMLALVGCAQRVSRPPDGVTTVATSSSDDVAIHPASPSVSTTPFTVPASTLGNPASTATRATDPATTMEGEVSCADFEAMLAFERMKAVRNDSAPSAGECDVAVLRAMLMSRTYGMTLDITNEYTRYDDVSPILELTECEVPATLHNPFDESVIYWGVRRLKSDETVIAYGPFATEVIRPGGQTSLALPWLGIPHQFCSVSFVPILAPVSPWSRGADMPMAASDDPQASDDPEVWGPALLEADLRDVDVPGLINWFEDIHSAELQLWLGRDDGPLRMGPDQDAYSATICEAEPADLGPDTGGEYSWLVFAMESDSKQFHGLGFFSRGEDRRWRFMGNIRTIDEVVDPSDPRHLPGRLVE